MEEKRTSYSPLQVKRKILTRVKARAAPEQDGGATADLYAVDEPTLYVEMSVPMELLKPDKAQGLEDMVAEVNNVIARHLRQLREG